MNVFGSHASLIVHLSSFSRSDPVLFPYQSRFNSDLSPFFLSLALGEEGRICGRETSVLLDLSPISPSWLFLPFPWLFAFPSGVGLWMLRPSPASPPLLVRCPSDEMRRIPDGRAADA